MKELPMPTRTTNPQLPKGVPLEFAGKWVAWNTGHTHIIAHADSLHQLWQIVREENVDDPVFERVPRTDVRFVGTR